MLKSVNQISLGLGPLSGGFERASMDDFVALETNETYSTLAKSGS